MTVDGVVADTPGVRVPEGALVTVDGQAVAPEAHSYVLLHKPAGVVTTVRDTHGRPTVIGLVGAGRRLFPIGRLDAGTTGLLLLTNDGDLAHRLAHPRYEIGKVYVADVDGEPTDQTLERLAGGLDLDDGRTAPATARRLGPSRVELTIHEGRKHQVKRMLAAVGHPVVRLHRSGYGPLTLGALAPGDWRELEPDEVEALRSATPAKRTNR